MLCHILPTFRIFCLPTRWSTTLPSKVNMPHAMNFRDKCGTNLVTQPSDIRGIKTLEIFRVELETSNHRTGSPGRAVPSISADPCRCRSILEQISQSRPDSGLSFQVKVLKTFQVVPSLLGCSPVPLNPEPQKLQTPKP